MMAVVGYLHISTQKVKSYLKISSCLVPEGPVDQWDNSLNRKVMMMITDYY